jgi:hypothetical protein
LLLITPDHSLAVKVITETEAIMEFDCLSKWPASYCHRDGVMIHKTKHFQSSFPEMAVM